MRQSSVLFLRVATAIAATGAVALAIGPLPACVHLGTEPLVNLDAGMDTCTSNGGTCRSDDLVALDGPCGSTANKASDLQCGSSPFGVTGVSCCMAKQPCFGERTCEDEGTCDGQVVSTLYCATGKSCCARSTTSDGGATALLDAPND